MKKILPMIVALLVGACQGPAPQPETSAPEVAPLRTLTIDRLLWSDDTRLPPFLLEAHMNMAPFLLGHVVEWRGFPTMKRFTEEADKRFALEEDGRVVAYAYASTGGTTSGDGSIRFVWLWPRDADSLDRSHGYSLVPSSGVEGYSWTVLCAVEPPATR